MYHIGNNSTIAAYNYCGFMSLFFVCALSGLVYSQSYIRRTESLTFQDAEFLCSFLYDTHLASIHNDVQNDEAKTICQQDTNCWIGLSDSSIESNFAWSDFTVFDYGIPIGLGSGPWTVNNPDDLDGEDCVQLITNAGWNDITCNTKQLPLCNYPTPLYIFNDNKNYQRIPSASNIIGIMDILDEIYVEFKLSVNSFIAGSGYSNILHIGNDQNISIPSISIDTANRKLYFAVFAAPLQNYSALSNVVELNEWYHVTIHIQMDHLKISVNNSIVLDESIVSHQILTDQQIYLSDRWDVPTSDVILSGLTIATSNSNELMASGSFNYFCDYENRFTNVSGAWNIDKNTCILTKLNQNGGQITWLGDVDSSSKNWVNYKVELVYAINTGEDAGLIIRASNAGSTINSGQHYNIHLHIPNNEVVFAKIDNDFTKLYGYNYSYLSLYHNTEYTLRVEAYENTFTLFLQNEYLFNITDTSFTSGSIGIRDYYSTATYKSLRITFPTDNVLYTVNPTITPSNNPTNNPTNTPTTPPTQFTNPPSKPPTNNPSNIPTYNPTILPTISPTNKLNEGGVTEPLSTNNNIIKNDESKNDNIIQWMYILISLVSALFIISIILILLIYYKRKEKKNANDIMNDPVMNFESHNDNNIQLVKAISDSNDIKGIYNIDLEQIDIKTLPSEKTKTDISESSSSENGLFDNVNETHTTKGLTAGMTQGNELNDNMKQQPKQRTKSDSMYVKTHKETDGDKPKYKPDI